MRRERRESVTPKGRGSRLKRTRERDGREERAVLQKDEGSGLEKGERAGLERGGSGTEKGREKKGG